MGMCAAIKHYPVDQKKTLDIDARIFCLAEGVQDLTVAKLVAQLLQASIAFACVNITGIVSTSDRKLRIPALTDETQVVGLFLVAKESPKAHISDYSLHMGG